MAWGAHCLVQSSVSERKVGLVQQWKPQKPYRLFGAHDNCGYNV